MIRYSSPQTHACQDGSKWQGKAYTIEDWPWLDILLCKVINLVCNRLSRCFTKIGKADWGLRFCDNIHIPIAKWQDTRRYFMIFESPEVKFEHLKGQSVWRSAEWGG